MLVSAAQRFQSHNKARTVRASDDFTASPGHPNQSILSLFAQHCGDFLSIQNERDEYVYVAPNCARLFGWAAQELLGQSLHMLIHADDVEEVIEQRSRLWSGLDIRSRYRFKCRTREADTYRWVETCSKLSECGYYIVTTTRDIDDEIRQLQQLERIACRDPLTDLLNRRAAERVLNSELARSARKAKPMTIAFFDVDDFKQVNDTHGHHVGDLLLKDIADCVGRGKRAYDVLGRWGGDEFILILPETSIDDGLETVERIRCLIMQELPGVSLSFGLSSNADAETSEDLLAHADAALYTVKRAGGNRAHRWL